MEGAMNINQNPQFSYAMPSHFNTLPNANLIVDTNIQVPLEVIEEAKFKSTGATTPNKSVDLTSDMIISEQFAINEAIQRGAMNNIINSHIPSIISSLNSVKLCEYIEKEKEILEQSEHKETITFTFSKKPFKDMISSLSGISNRVESFFPLPRVKKNEKYVLHITKKV